MSLVRNKQGLVEKQKLNGEHPKINKGPHVRSCRSCRTAMKKQVIGSNVVHYCKHCGCIRST